MEDLEFMECEICNTKRGSTTLCQSCFNNRETIEKLKRILKKEEGRIDILKRIINL